MWRAACCAGTRGDTFKVTLRLELQDQDGEAVTVGADDSVTVRFSDEQNAPVHTFFTGVTGNCVTLVFDETVSAKPCRGRIATISSIRTATKRRSRGATARRQNEVSGCEWKSGIRSRSQLHGLVSRGGVKAAEVTDEGHLVLTLTDGSRADLGSVLGPQGARGEQGLPGPKGETGTQGQTGAGTGRPRGSGRTCRPAGRTRCCR